MTDVWFLQSRRVVTPQGVRPAAIQIEKGKIQAVWHPEHKPDGFFTHDVGNLVVSPGLVDPHVHINEPGRTDWEGFATATRSAAKGGITTVVDMPLNSSPVTTSVAAFEKKLAAAEGQCHIDVGFWGGVVPANGKELVPLMEAGVLGFKAFLCHSGIDDFPNVSLEDLDDAMPILAEMGFPLLAHAEWRGESPTDGDPRVYDTWHRSRPKAWEDEAIRLLIERCREYGGLVHIVHLSSADALPMLANARSEGYPVTVETAPHYLVFQAEAIPDGATAYKCAPPIREKTNQDQLWEGLRSGVIDLVATDHSPAPPGLKQMETGDFMKAWGGIASLQLLLPAVWTFARDKGFSISDVNEWLAERPAKLIGRDGSKGTIAPGYDADFVVWDPDATFRVTPDLIEHRHKLTPYLDMTLSGVIDTTFLRGEKVFHQGQFLDTPMGRLLRHRQR